MRSRAFYRRRIILWGLFGFPTLESYRIDKASGAPSRDKVPMPIALSSIFENIVYSSTWSLDSDLTRQHEKLINHNRTKRYAFFQDDGYRPVRSHLVPICISSLLFLVRLINPSRFIPNQRGECNARAIISFSKCNGYRARPLFGRSQ
jgi:hypothetical protein